MDPGYPVDFEFHHVAGVALCQPLKPVVEAEDMRSMVMRLDGRSRNDAVNAGCGTSSDQYAKRFHALFS
jgi:hypothetical protein